ncbi:hypothetical protein BKA61DRAFT_120271 [Leptodontidium sp. MPI-SDFR-AT-0119]|nr:hypothetical protein BKA61DRAFT_120271 [Leptodontidium sp. MPI-SDFR-AT-0119]
MDAQLSWLGFCCTSVNSFNLGSSSSYLASNPSSHRQRHCTVAATATVTMLTILTILNLFKSQNALPNETSWTSRTSQSRASHPAMVVVSVEDMTFGKRRRSTYAGEGKVQVQFVRAALDEEAQCLGKRLYLRSNAARGGRLGWGGAGSIYRTLNSCCEISCHCFLSVFIRPPPLRLPLPLYPLFAIVLSKPTHPSLLLQSEHRMPIPSLEPFVSHPVGMMFPVPRGKGLSAW